MLAVNKIGNSFHPAKAHIKPSSFREVAGNGSAEIGFRLSAAEAQALERIKRTLSSLQQSGQIKSFEEADTPTDHNRFLRVQVPGAKCEVSMVLNKIARTIQLNLENGAPHEQYSIVDGIEAFEKEILRLANNRRFS